MEMLVGLKKGLPLPLPLVADPIPKRVPQDKFFGAVLSRFDNFVVTGREGLIGGAHFLMDVRDDPRNNDRDTRGHTHKLCVREMAEASGARVLEVRIDAMRLLHRKLSRQWGRDECPPGFLKDTSVRSVSGFLVDHIKLEVGFYCSENSPNVVEFVMYLGSGSSMAKLRMGGDVCAVLDDDLRGPHAHINDIADVAQAFDLMISRVPRHKLRWTARAHVSPREVAHAIYDCRGVDPHEGRIVFAEYTDPQGFFAAYANSGEGLRPGIDWPFIARPRMGIFGGPITPQEHQACIHALFQFIASGSAHEFGHDTQPLLRRGEGVAAHGIHEDLYQPPSFLDPQKHTTTQIVDFAVSQLATAYDEQRLSGLASMYGAILDEAFRDLGLDSFESYLDLFIKPQKL